MKLTEIKRTLEQENIQLTKSLGQNFLHDGNQLRRILALADLHPRDRVLEVGPGLGPLTELLLEQAGEVLAIEKDARLVEVLRKRLACPSSAAASKLQLIHGDALDYLRGTERSWAGWKLVANLPYSVASPLLVELALATPGPDVIVATLQAEVARRIMSGPGHRDYGVLTLLLQLDYAPSEWFKIPPGCFYPEPDVDSACVSLRRRTTPLAPPECRATFVKVVKRAFSQRRKMMPKLLKQDWPAHRLEHAFAAAHIPLTARAESVSLEQYAALARELRET